MTPRPMRPELWHAIQAERMRLQVEGYTGKYTLEFDCLDGEELKIKMAVQRTLAAVLTKGQ